MWSYIPLLACPWTINCLRPGGGCEYAQTDGTHSIAVCEETSFEQSPEKNPHPNRKVTEREVEDILIQRASTTIARPPQSAGREPTLLLTPLLSVHHFDVHPTPPLVYQIHFHPPPSSQSDGKRSGPSHMCGIIKKATSFRASQVVHGPLQPSPVQIDF